MKSTADQIATQILTDVNGNTQSKHKCAYVVSRAVQKALGKPQGGTGY